MTIERREKPITDAEIALGMSLNALAAAERLIKGHGKKGDWEVIADTRRHVERIRAEMAAERGVRR